MGCFPLSGRQLIAACVTLLVLSGCAHPPAAEAQAMPSLRMTMASDVPLSGPETDAHIAEASQRFDIPEHWIRAVMHTESTGDERAVSHAGAMGLMQIMPGTWVELRDRHGLGSDPFDPRDNILAGAAYLSELHDRFGAPGFLAAYNAGPGRYSEYLATGRPLPLETRRYVSALAPVIGNSAVAGTRRNVARLSQKPGGSTAPDLQSVRRAEDSEPADPMPGDWRAAPLFAEPRSRRSPASGLSANPQRSDASEAFHLHVPEPSGGLFPQSGHGDRP